MPVYMIRHGEASDAPIKIGVTRLPINDRIGIMQSNTPVALRLMRLLDGDWRLERELHERYSANRIRGEWFSFSTDMLGDVGAEDLPLPPPSKRSGPRKPPKLVPIMVDPECYDFMCKLAVAWRNAGGSPNEPAEF